MNKLFIGAAIVGFAMSGSAASLLLANYDFEGTGLNPTPLGASIASPITYDPAAGGVPLGAGAPGNPGQGAYKGNQATVGTFYAFDVIAASINSVDFQVMSPGTAGSIPDVQVTQVSLQYALSSAGPWMSVGSLGLGLADSWYSGAFSLGDVPTMGHAWFRIAIDTVVGNPPGHADISLDNVNVYGVAPEPTECAMIAGLGLAAFAGYRRFRKD